MADAPSPLIGRIDGSGGVHLRTLFWPAGSPVGGVCVIHGLGEHAGRYDHVARRLNGLDLDVFGHDHRGHGGSDGPRGHFDRLADVLSDLDLAMAEAQRHLAPGPRFVLAHSMGGLAGLAWIQSRTPGLAGAVVSAPWLATAAPVPGWKRWAGRLADRWLPRLAMDTGNRPHHVTSDPAMAAALAADPLCHTRMSARAFAEVQRGQARVLGAADRVKVDALFLVPGADPLADATTTRAFAEALPPERTTVLELPGLRHEALNEADRDAVLDAVVAWIRPRLPSGLPPGTGG